MKVLVTGSAGRIGRVVVSTLREAGYGLRTFDRCASREEDHYPGSTLSYIDVCRAVHGCDAIVHLAAIPNDWRGRADEVFSTNVLGTFHMMQAAAEMGITRFVFYSSIQALGLANTDQKPEYLPLDDAHVRRPRRPYPLSKNFGEDMGRYFSETADMSVICLRPPMVSDEDWYARWAANINNPNPWGMNHAKTDVWAYCDIRDVAHAAVLGLQTEVKYGVYLLAAKDTMVHIPTAKLVADYFPEVPLRLTPEQLEADPYHGLIDTSAAERDLGWKPRYSWHDHVNKE